MTGQMALHKSWADLTRCYRLGIALKDRTHAEGGFTQ